MCDLSRRATRAEALNFIYLRARRRSWPIARRSVDAAAALVAAVQTARAHGSMGTRKRRSDTGRCRKLTPEQKKLLLDIRREFSSAAVPLILRTLVNDGRLSERTVSASAVQRLFRQHARGRQGDDHGAS